MTMESAIASSSVSSIHQEGSNNTGQNDKALSEQQQQQQRQQNSTQSKTKDFTNVPNSEYAKQSYWDDRFTEEESYEWLVSYNDVAPQLIPFLNSSDRILIVGCGNSNFSEKLYDAGYTQIINIDYSSIVIENMKQKNHITRPNMEWKVMDMTDMNEFNDSIFDVVIDKAAMDAIMAQEGDVWNPNEDVKRKVRSMCCHVSRILKSNGYHLQISFQQPHFRKKYLLGWHKCDDDLTTSQISTKQEDFSDDFRWSFRYEAIGGKEGGFENFFYIMRNEQ